MVTERNLMVHSCEKRSRWLSKDEKHVRYGFVAYSKFFEISYRIKAKKEFREFIDSPQYIGFVKFGRHILDINALEPEGFIEYLIRSNLKLEQWYLDSTYEMWIRELGRKEPPMKAIERNILLMQQWALDTGNDWADFFRLVNTQLATKWIKAGRISPWLLHAGFGNPLFDRMSDEQLMMVKTLIDPLFWKNRFTQYLDDVEDYKQLLKQAGL